MAAGTLQDGRDRIPARRLAAFDHAEAWLRRKAAYWLPKVGLDKFEPVQIYNPATVYRTWPLRSRHLALRYDVRHLTECDVLLLLPGWEGSEGCLVECRVADAIGVQKYQMLPTRTRSWALAKVEIPDL
jgi:hypothetical protein